MTTQTYRLMRLVKKTDDICLIHLAPIKTLIHFQPGQYVLFHLPNGEKAPFSIASRSLETLEFHIRHGQNNPVSDRFLDHLKRHEEIGLSGAFGQCVLPPSPQPLIFLSGGTGVASHKPLIEQALEQDYSSVRLYWGIKEPEDLYLPEWLERMSQHPNFNYCLVLSGEAPDWSGPKGWAHEVMMAQEDISKALIYVSGPYPMVQAVAGVYRQKSYPLEHLRCDML